MPIFKQVSDGNFWKYTDGTAEPMWLNSSGIGYPATREEERRQDPRTLGIAFYEGPSRDAVFYATLDQKLNDIGDGSEALLKDHGVRRLSQDEVQAFIASLPLLREPAPEPAAP